MHHLYAGYVTVSLSLRFVWYGLDPLDRAVWTVTLHVGLPEATSLVGVPRNTIRVWKFGHDATKFAV